MELIDRARSGDAAAFEQLVGPYRHEMQVHCYRILGSVADAEDALQETLAAAWQGLGGFEDRAGHPHLAVPHRHQPLPEHAARRRGGARGAAACRWRRAARADPAGRGRLARAVPRRPARPAGQRGRPEARYEAHEAISLAFVTALQLLPPRQRAVLILRDVLDFSAREVAGLLGTTEQSVTSALKRARATLARELPSPTGPPPPPGSPAEQALLSRLIRAFEAADVDGARRPADRGRLAAHAAGAAGVPGPGRGQALLRDRGLPPGPPLPADPDPGQRPARVRRLPARPAQQTWHTPCGLFVITLAGDRISAITRFDNAAFPASACPAPSPTTDPGQLARRSLRSSRDMLDDGLSGRELRIVAPVTVFEPGCAARSTSMSGMYFA